MLYLNGLDRRPIHYDLVRNTCLPEELSQLRRISDADEVLRCFDVRKELNGAPDISRWIPRCAKERYEQRGLIAVVPALLAEGLFRPLHASPVPFGLDVVLHVFVDRDRAPVEGLGKGGDLKRDGRFSRAR